MTEEKKEYDDVGAIWIKKSAKGKRYLSMTITIDGEDKYFVAFKNQRKKETHPDYRIYPSIPGMKSDSPF